MAGNVRQTQRYLTQRLRQAGVRPKNKYGQNFLIDLNLLELLVRTAQIEPQDVVLEVGTGTGSLTQRLVEQARHVISVEIDPQLHQLAREELHGAENLTLLCQDALKNKNQLAPNLLEEVEQQLSQGAGRFLLVANLPYCVATPVISNLLALARPPETMTVTIQKELADRITASPGTKDYGALSVWVQCQAHARCVRTLPPSAFWPRPAVSSAILQIQFVPELRKRIPDLDFFHQFVRQVFLHRRKLLRGVLQSQYRKQMPKARVDQLLAELELPPECRAEELSVDQLLRLAEQFRQEVQR